jgi:hypothetical protein
VSFAEAQIRMGVDYVKVPFAISREFVHAYSGSASHHAEISYTSERVAPISNR